MPRVNIYIRNKDWEAWNNIPDKPAWIHEGLNTGLVMIPAKSVPKEKPFDYTGKLTAEEDTLTEQAVEAFNSEPVEAPRPEPKLEVCSHGNARQYCKFIDCKLGKKKK